MSGPHMLVGLDGGSQYCGDIGMYRHICRAKPGYWHVAHVTSRSIDHFFDGLVNDWWQGKAAVVDDFGTLVPVELPQ